MMRTLLLYTTAFVTMITVATLTAAPSFGQALVTASKQMDISAFGGYEYVTPDKGPNNNNGLVLGGDFTRYIGHLPIAPSIEARYNLANGTYVNEHSFVAGLRVEALNLRRYHPYANFLIGPGSITYNVVFIPGYTHDTSVVTSFGGGVDIDLVPHFQLKFDYQAQSWSFDSHNKIQPNLATLGLVYRIPFRPHVGSNIHKMPPMPQPSPSQAAPPPPAVTTPSAQPAATDSTSTPAPTTPHP